MNRHSRHHRHSSQASRRRDPAKDVDGDLSLPAGRPLDQLTIMVYHDRMPREPVVSVRMSPAWLDEARRALMLGEDALASDVVRTAIRRCIGDGDMEPDTNTDTHESAT